MGDNGIQLNCGCTGLSTQNLFYRLKDEFYSSSRHDVSTGTTNAGDTFYSKKLSLIINGQNQQYELQVTDIAGSFYLALLKGGLNGEVVIPSSNDLDHIAFDTSVLQMALDLYCCGIQFPVPKAKTEPPKVVPKEENPLENWGSLKYL